MTTTLSPRWLSAHSCAESATAQCSPTNGHHCSRPRQPYDVQALLRALKERPDLKRAVQLHLGQPAAEVARSSWRQQCRQQCWRPAGARHACHPPAAHDERCNRRPVSDAVGWQSPNLMTKCRSPARPPPQVLAQQKGRDWTSTPAPEIASFNLRADSADARLYFAAIMADLPLGDAEGGVVFTKNNHYEPVVSAGSTRDKGGHRAPCACARPAANTLLPALLAMQLRLVREDGLAVLAAQECCTDAAAPARRGRLRDVVLGLCVAAPQAVQADGAAAAEPAAAAATPFALIEAEPNCAGRAWLKQVTLTLHVL